MMRRTTIVTLLLAAVMSVALFFLKYEVTGLEDQLDGLNHSIDQDRETMHVLQAEWGHLNEIERVRALSHRYLDLGPTPPSRLVTLDQLPAEGVVPAPPVPNGTRK
jgi:hypothetical protein